MKRTILSFVMAATALLAGCDPMDDTSWTHNESVYLSWTEANPLTGRRPAEIDVCNIYFYPQTGNIANYVFQMPTDEASVELPAGDYDMLVRHDITYIKDADYFQTAKVVLPTSYNTSGERVIVKNPTKMIYIATDRNLRVSDEEQVQRRFAMRRVLKKLNLQVQIEDSLELTRDVSIDLSGLATELRIASNQIISDKQAVLLVNLKKYGRSQQMVNRYLTTYTGESYLLGVTGSNIMYLNYTNAKEEEQRVYIDVTGYLSNWSTDEVTVHIKVNAKDNTYKIERWGDQTTEVELD